MTDCKTTSNNTVVCAQQTTLFKLTPYLFNNILIKTLESFHTDFSKLSINGIQKVLETIKNDTMIHTSKDIKICFELHLFKNSVILMINADDVLFPFYVNSKTINLIFDVKTLDNMTEYHLDVQNPFFLNIDNELLKIVKKLDLFLNYDSFLYNSIIENGINPTLSKIEMGLFNLDYNENTLTFSSKLHGFFESDFDLPFFKIHFYRQRISIIIAGQMIALTAEEFLNTDNDDIIAIVTSLLKIKNLPIASMANIKDYLLTQDMKMI